ncbi:MAG: tetratricopeptide repeat protein, partial [Planctomycetales bacterium]
DLTRRIRQMSQAELELDVRQLVASSSSFGPREIEQIVQGMAANPSLQRGLKEAVQELEQDTDPSPATKVRIGVAHYLLGDYSDAVRYLERADGGALALFFLAKSQLALEAWEAATEQFAAAGKAGYDREICALGQVEAKRCGGQAEEALHILEQLNGPVQQSAEYLFQRGATESVLREDPQETVQYYERALEANESHAGALFGLALQNERHGNDSTARSLYERSASQFPPRVGVLLNLGLLYEDGGDFDLAAQCFERILKIHPDHPRVRMFWRDAESSKTMIYNEEEQARSDRLRQVMSVPVTDFELSVRSRNCLQRMGVMTLGDLTKISEQDLLNSKNFGETSLTEIKEMLSSKGLRLGHVIEQKRAPEMTVDPASMSPDEQAVLNQPVGDLNLSVRARKCMIRLGINTIGELMRCTQDELLECKNFGVTSLNEVREKLTAHSLKLRGE